MVKDINFFGMRISEKEKNIILTVTEQEWGSPLGNRSFDGTTLIADNGYTGSLWDLEYILSVQGTDEAKKLKTTKEELEDLRSRLRKFCDRVDSQYDD